MRLIVWTVFVLLFPALTYSQFSGRITYKSGSGELTEVILSADKIKVKSKKLADRGVDAMGLVGSEMIFDLKAPSITLMRDAREAVVVDLVSLQALMQGFSALSGQENPESAPPLKVIRLAERKKIAGHMARKIQIVSADKPDDVVFIWYSEKLAYSWQAVSESLKTLPGTEAIGPVFSESWVPLRVEWRDGEQNSTLEAISIVEKTSPADFAIPADYKITTMQQFMQNLMLKSMSDQ